MTSTRKTATIVGLLFLTQTLAFIIAEQLLGGVLKRPNYMTVVSAHANALTLGGLCAVVSGVAVVSIAVLLFPLFKPTSEPLALGYVCERVIELVLQLLFFLVVPLLMIAISNGLRDGTINASSSQSLGPILKAIHDLAIVVLYLVTSVGGTILAVLLYRSQLVPRWIAVLALIGYPVLLVWLRPGPVRCNRRDKGRRADCYCPRRPLRADPSDLAPRQRIQLIRPRSARPRCSRGRENTMKAART